MKALRNIIALVAVAFLGVGYFASQLAILNQSVSRFAYQMDQPPIRMLAFALLVGAVVLSFVPDDEEPV